LEQDILEKVREDEKAQLLDLLQEASTKLDIDDLRLNLTVLMSVEQKYAQQPESREEASQERVAANAEAGGTAANPQAPVLPEGKQEAPNGDKATVANVTSDDSQGAAQATSQAAKEEHNDGDKGKKKDDDDEDQDVEERDSEGDEEVKGVGAEEEEGDAEEEGGAEEEDEEDEKKKNP